MITLEELLENRKYNSDISDIQIIRTFFELNDMEEEGLDLIHELTQSKLEKLKRRERIARTWISYLPMAHLFKEYDSETGTNLLALELDFISNGLELSKARLKWAEENLPNIKKPSAYFNPLIEYLDERGIRFKGEKPIKNKIFGE